MKTSAFLMLRMGKGNLFHTSGAACIKADSDFLYLMALLLVFNLSIMHFQQFSNYLLPIGGPRVKQIIITPTKKSSKFCEVSKTIMSSRHIKKRTNYA